jgi:hypothetical protein
MTQHYNGFSKSEKLIKQHIFTLNNQKMCFMSFRLDFFFLESSWQHDSGSMFHNDSHFSLLPDKIRLVLPLSPVAERPRSTTSTSKLVALAISFCFVSGVLVVSPWPHNAVSLLRIADHGAPDSSSIYSWLGYAGGSLNSLSHSSGGRSLFGLALGPDHHQTH